MPKVITFEKERVRKGMTKRKNSKWKIVIACIVVVLLVVAGSVYFWQNNLSKKSGDETTATDSTLSNSVDTKKSSETDTQSDKDITESISDSTENPQNSDTPVEKHGALSVKKIDSYEAPTIVDQQGNAVQLRAASTHGVHWFPEYVNKDGFQSLRDEWGLNTVRLAIYPREGGYLQGNQTLLDSKIAEGVEAAKELGMYVIIDWHVLAYNPNEDLEVAKNFFQKYAEQYKDYNNVIFEICNEPTGTPWYDESGNDIYTYCKEVSKVIRDCGNNSIIICGTNDWSQRVDEVAAKPLKDDGFENIMYSIHFYAGTHYDNIKNNVRSAISHGTPVFASEFGCCDASGNGGYDFANADDWMNLLKENNISYACWSLCNKAESASYISPSCSKTSGWTTSDLTETGVWLMNTSRGLAEAEEGTMSVGAPVESDKSETTDKSEKSDKAQTIAQEASTNGCSATIVIGNEWDDGVTADGVVKNESSNGISGWTVEFDFGGEISNIWCAKMVSHSGSHYVIEAEDYNKEVGSGEQVTFGFNATKAAGQKVTITNVVVK